MSNLMYDFGKYNEVISVYIETLTQNSIDKFRQQVKDDEITNVEKDSEELAGSIMDLQDFLYYNYKNYPEKFIKILKAMAYNFKTLAVLPKNERGIYGKTQVQNQIIYVNPNLKDTRYLTGEERKRLYLAHEVGHIINNEWMKSAKEYLDGQIAQKMLSVDQAQMMYDGFSMLDEATAQDRAEDYAYWSAGKTRPKMRTVRSQRMFDSEPYRTNFDYYGELQEPAATFAKTIRGIDGKDDERALRDLSKRAVSPDFFDELLKEQRKDRKMPFFTKTMQFMGLLKRAAYANFRAADQAHLKNSKRYLHGFREAVSCLKNQKRDSAGDEAR